MKKLLLGCAALALFASVMSIMLWRDLHTERQTSAALQARLSEMETSPRAPALPAAMSRPAPAPATVPASGPAVTAPVASEPAAAMNAAMPRNLVARNQVTERDLLKDPEYRKARLGLLRTSLLQSNPDLAQELGLPPSEIDKLIGLLANNQMEMNSIPPPGYNQPLDQAQMQAQAQEMERTRRLMQDDLDIELKALLGPTVYAKWRDYEQTRPARQQVVQFGRPLETAGLPLTSEQIRPLATVMAAEQARQRRDMQAMESELVASQARRDPQVQMRIQEERLKQQVESNRRLLDAAAPHLSARQLEILRTTLEQQSTLQRVSLRLRREAEQRNQPAAAGAP